MARYEPKRWHPAALPGAVAIAAVLCLYAIPSCASAQNGDDTGRQPAQAGSSVGSRASSNEALTSARVLMLNGSMDQALDAYTRVIVDFPKSAEALRARGMVATIQERLGQSDQAISSWTVFTEHAPDGAASDRAVLNIARLCASGKQYAKGTSVLLALAGRHRNTTLWSTCMREAARLVYASRDSAAISSFWRSAERGADERSLSHLVETVVAVYSDARVHREGAKVLQGMAADRPGTLMFGAAMLEAGKLLDICGDPGGALGAYRKAVDGSANTRYGSDAVISAKSIRLQGSPAGDVLGELKRIAARHHGSRAGARAVICESELLAEAGDLHAAERVLAALPSRCPKSWDERRDAEQMLTRLRVGTAQLRPTPGRTAGLCRRD